MGVREDWENLYVQEYRQRQKFKNLMAFLGLVLCLFTLYYCYKWIKEQPLTHFTYTATGITEDRKKLTIWVVTEPDESRHDSYKALYWTRTQEPRSKERPAKVLHYKTWFSMEGLPAKSPEDPFMVIVVDETDTLFQDLPWHSSAPEFAP